MEIKISTDKELLEVDTIYNYLKTSYWAKTRTKEEVIETIKNSRCFGLYKNDKQIGFARVLTDKVAYAYLMDVFILEEFRGQGYSKLLLDRIMQDSELKGVKQWMLKTKDAHWLYEKFGFNELQNPEKFMELRNTA